MFDFKVDPLPFRTYEIGVLPRLPYEGITKFHTSVAHGDHVGRRFEKVCLDRFSKIPD